MDTETTTISKTLVNTPETLTRLCEALDHADSFGLDTEAHGPTLFGQKKGVVDPQRGTCTGTSIYLPELGGFYVPLNHLEGNLPIAEHYKLAAALNETMGEARSHNRKFDQHILHRLGVRVDNWKCSLVLAWLQGLAGETQKGRGNALGLKALTKALWGVQQQTFDEVAKGRQWNQVPVQEALSYAADDAFYSWRLVEDYLPKLSCPRETWELETEFIDVVVEMERAGVLLDQQRVRELADGMDKDLADLQAEWDFMFPGVSITSTKQLIEHFCETLVETEHDEFGEVIQRVVVREALWPKAMFKQTAGGKPSLNKEGLKALLKSNVSADAKTAAQLRLDYMFISKNRTTYTDGLIEAAGLWPDSRIRATFHQTGTWTGRLSSAHPNMQNIPLKNRIGKLLRECFIAPPGRKFARADFNQLQLRILAHFVGEGALFDAFHRGEDAHTATAKVAGVSRDEAKITNYLVLFGGSWKRLASFLGCSRSKAEKIMAAVQAAIGSDKLMPRIVEACRKRGYVKTLGQRKLRIDIGPSKFDPGTRKAGSGVIQGAEGDIVKKAMVMARREYRRRPELGAFQFIQIHDEIGVEAPEETIDEAGAILKECMEQSYALRVPLVADLVITDNLGK